MTKLEKYLREKIDYKNKMHDFDLGTETLKIWLDEYNVSIKKEKFFCCVVSNNQPKCKEQCQFCIDWVDDAEEQKI